MMDSTDKHVRVSNVLNRTANELFRMNERALDLQCLTCEFATDDKGPRLSEALQGIDRMTQELSGLAGFVLALSTLIDSDVQVDPSGALQGVTLTSLKERLSSDDVEEDTSVSDIEWFDAQSEAI